MTEFFLIFRIKRKQKNVKTLVNDLKTTITSKDKYVLKQEDKDKIMNTKYAKIIYNTN